MSAITYLILSLTFTHRPFSHFDTMIFHPFNIYSPSFSILLSTLLTQYSPHPFTPHSTLSSQHSQIYTLHSLSIAGTLTYPKDGSEKGPVIVFVHGTMSSKDHNFVPDVCKKMIADYGENALYSFFYCLLFVNYHLLLILLPPFFFIPHSFVFLLYDILFIFRSLFFILNYFYSL